MKRILLVLLFVGVFSVAGVFAASGGGGQTMPWDSILIKVLDALTGTTAKILGGIAIAVGGVMFFMSDTRQAKVRIGYAIVGLAIILNLDIILNTFFAFTISGALLPW